MEGRSYAGFSLLQLIISLCVAMILLTLGVPGIAKVVHSNRMAAYVNDLRGSLALTRAEAIKRNQHVVICKSNDSLFCRKEAEWHDGWIIYIDADRDRQRDEDESIIRVRHNFSGEITLDYRAFGSKNYIAYRPRGHTLTNGTFIFCGQASSELARALILTKSGRVRFSRTSASGHPLNCP